MHNFSVLIFRFFLCLLVKLAYGDIGTNFSVWKESHAIICDCSIDRENNIERTITYTNKNPHFKLKHLAIKNKLLNELWCIAALVYVYCIHIYVCVYGYVNIYIYMYICIHEHWMCVCRRVTMPRSQIYWPLYVCFLC